MTAAAFEASYSDWKVIKTRSVVQIVLEVPLEQADMAYQVLDGMPQPGSERRVGVARLQPAAQERTRPEAEPLPGGAAAVAKAAELCREGRFHTFLYEEFHGGWKLMKADDAGKERAAEFVRWHCGVKSRAEFKTNPEALARWRQLYEHYEGWKTL